MPTIVTITAKEGVMSETPTSADSTGVPAPEALLECDLVMKGGITSGVVYPTAAVALHTRYRFRKIGGSSAGAIAAVLAAAAEFARQSGVTAADAGFARLEQLPVRLQRDLKSLFQPSRSTAGVFDFLMALSEPGRSAGRKALGAVGRLIRGAPGTVALTTVVLLLPWFATSLALVGGLHGHVGPLLRALLVWVLPALAAGVVAAALRLAVRALGEVNSNGFGLCAGHLSDDGPALTDWLARELNLTAGRGWGPGETPLTFGDLWGPAARTAFRQRLSIPGSTTPDDGDEFSPDADYLTVSPVIGWNGFDPDIDVRVMTTSLTEQVPRVFPFFDDAYLFCPACWSVYFPSWVMAHLEARSRNPGEAREDGTRGWSSGGRWIAASCPTHGTPLRRLPLARDMPIVVAARVSLSFPLLISAVPFHYLDVAKLPDQVDVVRAWFSDGGITSNFPMQFFDSWLPRWPTFGINLDGFDARYDPAGTTVSLPDPGDSSRTLHETPIVSVLGFLKSIQQTMQNWPDRLQMELPGFRDRIVTVYTDADEGGLHLQMSDSQIARLSAKGGQAGERLLTNFSLPVHRWLRFRIAMNGLSMAMARYGTGWTSFEQQVPSMPAGACYGLPDEAPVRAEAGAFATLADAWGRDGWPGAVQAPRPESELRFMQWTTI
ncbi:MAG TPA: hypothetical protein VHO26_03540 [Propionibacteriaceae bacterium]|nr:hypothetical protein [Propionibacteriaceae bacterium]